MILKILFFFCNTGTQDSKKIKRKLKKMSKCLKMECGKQMQGEAGAKGEKSDQDMQTKANIGWIRCSQSREKRLEQH